MTFPERRLDRPLDPPEAFSENTQDVVPTTERGQDPERSMHDLVNDSARPLTDEERKAADRDASNPGERVYAPASERVPKTVAGYRDVVEHTDTATPERQAAGPGNTSAGHWPQAHEPSFTRVSRPSNGDETTGSSTGEMDSDWNRPANRWMSNMSGGSLVPIGIGWLGVSICAGVGIWLWLRWQRERNKPINRLRRQARQAAALARERIADMPELPEEATRPAIGLGTALLPIAVVLWQKAQSRGNSRAEQARSRSRDAKGRAQQASKQASKKGREAVSAISEVDWQQRLMRLRDFWNPSRIEMEKVSIPKR
jgi:hypothetical protein